MAGATRRGVTRLIAASTIGTTIEFYDFFLYANAAALVFNKTFFPSQDPLTGTLLALGTYAVGFVARPIGGMVFGHVGDCHGRRVALVASLLLMGFATTAIGLLPTYAQVGAVAPVLLTVLRLLQGFALGGEWGGAVLLVAEHGNPHRRGYWTSWPQTGGPLGNLLCTAVLAALALTMNEQTFASWGWRVPFLLSAVLVLIGWWIRRRPPRSSRCCAATGVGCSSPCWPGSGRTPPFTCHHLPSGLRHPGAEPAQIARAERRDPRLHGADRRHARLRRTL